MSGDSVLPDAFHYTEHVESLLSPPRCGGQAGDSDPSTGTYRFESYWPDGTRIGQMKRCNRLQVRYANMGCLNLPRYGWVFVTVVYNPKRYPQKFLLVTNNLAANGPSVIEKYQKR